MPGAEAFWDGGQKTADLELDRPVVSFPHNLLSRTESLSSCCARCPGWPRVSFIHLRGAAGWGRLIIAQEVG